MKSMITITTQDPGFHAARAGDCWHLWDRAVYQGPRGDQVRVTLRAEGRQPHTPEGWTRVAIEAGSLEDVAPIHMMLADAESASIADIDTSCLVGVVRQSDGGRYTVAIGVGSRTRNLRGSYADAEAASVAARQALEARYQEMVDEIRDIRGGDLGWGCPLTPMPTDPQILYPAVRQSAWEAWAAATT